MNQQNLFLALLPQSALPHGQGFKGKVMGSLHDETTLLVMLVISPTSPQERQKMIC